MKMLALLGMLATCGVAVVAPSVAVAEYPSSEKQMKLDEGMTMEQVEALLGKPDEVAHVLNSRVWRYGRGFPLLSIYFERVKQVWVVSSWM